MSQDSAEEGIVINCGIRPRVTQCPFMATMVIKMGLAKTEKQANIVLVVFSMFNLLATLLILSASPSIFI
jgi:hypothetical protein